MAEENNENLVLTPEQQEVIFKPLVAFSQGVKKAGLVGAGGVAAVGGFVKTHADASGLGPRDFYTAGVEGSPIAMMLFDMTADLFTKTKDFMKDTLFGSKDDQPATESVQEEIKTGVENIDESLQEDPGSGLEEIERERERLREEGRKKKTGFAKAKDVARDVFGSKLLGAALVAGIAAWMLGDDGRKKIKDAVGGWFEDIEWKQLILDALPSPEEIVNPSDGTLATTGAVIGKARRLAVTGPLAPGNVGSRLLNPKPSGTGAPVASTNPSTRFLKYLADKGQNMDSPDGKIRWNAGMTNSAGENVGGRVVKGAVKASAAAAAHAAAPTAGSRLVGAVKPLGGFVLKMAPWITSGLTAYFTEQEINTLQELSNAGKIDSDFIEGLIWRKRAENYLGAAFGLGATALVGTAALGATAATGGVAAIPGMVATAATGYAATEVGAGVGGALSDWMNLGTMEDLNVKLQNLQPEQNAHQVVAKDLQSQQIISELGHQLRNMGGGGGVNQSTNIQTTNVPFVPPTVAFPTGSGAGTNNNSWMGLFTPQSQTAP